MAEGAREEGEPGKSAEKDGVKERTALEKGVREVYYFEDKQMCLKQLFRILKPGDAVLLKASHGMEFGKLLEAFKEKE